MLKLKHSLKRFVTEESGQSTTEYILILSVVVIVAMRFKSVFQEKLVNAVNTLGGKIEGAVNE